MKLRGLYVAALILAVLCGVLYWSNRQSTKTNASAKMSPDAPPKILSLDRTDITGLTIHRKEQAPLELSRNSGGWQITAPKALAADEESVSGILYALSSLNADRQLEDKASNLASYGLTDPALEVAVTLKDKKTEKLLIGDQTPSGNAYYAALAGDPRLFTVASYNKSSLDKTVDDLRDKRLLPVDFDKASQIELSDHTAKNKESITFARSKTGWQILRPGPYRADSGQVEELIRSLKDAKLETGADTGNEKAFHSASPFATAKVTGTFGTQELQVRKAKDDYYAESSAVSGVYKVPAIVGTSLDKSLEDFRDKKIFDFGYEDPEKIEIHDGGKSYFLTRSGSDWWDANGKKLDVSAVDALLGKIRDLSATKFPTSGYTTTVLGLTVTSNGGKRVERVSIAKAGDGYIAKRENDPALYEFASSAVQGMQESAANLKPAATPKK